MANIIKPKRSETLGSVPTTADLATGEIAINIADKKIYIRDGATNIVDLTETIDDYVPNTGGTFTGSLGVGGTLTATDLTVSFTAGFDGVATFNNEIRANGDVYIGTNSADTVYFNGTVSGLDLTDIDGIDSFGQANQVLTSDGDGTYSWGDAAVATHTHAISDIVNLQTELDSKSVNTHTHTLPELGISEGDAGEVLTTDGAGNYTWEVPEAGNEFYFLDGGNASNIYNADEPNIDAGGA